MTPSIVMMLSRAARDNGGGRLGHDDRRGAAPSP